MYMMIRRYRIGEGTVADLMNKIDVEFADRLQQALGLLGYQAIALDDGSILTTTLFATRADLAAGEAMAERVRDQLAEFRVEMTYGAGGRVMVSRGSEELLQPVHPG
ncbi:hypothetical protein HII36_14870 [Nonomuraea sp. NN258]|uniref:hypothetical protein n=1 Tax=Nonomuraea antri TaxID=2730852 RepID=UPI001569304B|nr:hypothetical protein [Nonomuraea antri]NRQ33115.1 hypothetical protein [Nonomuraea antri]